MELKLIKADELHWNFDFEPRSLWPMSLPVIALEIGSQLEVVAGFDRRSQKDISTLIVDGPLQEILDRFYPNLAPLETLRLNSKLKIQTSYSFLLDLPKDFQEYCDERAVPLKVMKPLEHVTEWIQEIGQSFLSVKPSGSQIRETLDLLCDLKFQGKSWSACVPVTQDPHKWILALRKLRFPQSYESDDKASQAVKTLPWPRGVQAKWERQGDQAGIAIQVKINNSREWNSLREGITKLDLEEGLWKS